jgi:hypothetical protein
MQRQECLISVADFASSRNPQLKECREWLAAVPNG